MQLIVYYTDKGFWHESKLFNTFIYKLAISSNINKFLASHHLGYTTKRNTRQHYKLARTVLAASEL